MATGLAIYKTSPLPPKGTCGGDILLADSTIFTTLLGGHGEPRALLAEHGETARQSVRSPWSEEPPNYQLQQTWPRCAGECA